MLCIFHSKKKGKKKKQKQTQDVSVKFYKRTVDTWKRMLIQHCNSAYEKMQVYMVTFCFQNKVKANDYLKMWMHIFSPYLFLIKFILILSFSYSQVNK